MNKKILLPTLALLLGSAIGILASQLIKPEPIRIACVGDSITWGAYLEDRAQECYPTRLQELLGSGCMVRNFGVNSSTVQVSGDKPYVFQTSYEKSQQFEPDLVLLMLGTNDTKEHNRGELNTFQKDYEALVDSYLNLPSRPRVILLTPPPVFVLPGESSPRFSMDTETLDKEIAVIKQVAQERDLTVINLNKEISDHPQFFMLDGVHPDLYGADFIARVIYPNLRSSLPQ